MLPDNVESSISFGGIYLPPDERVTTPVVDYELGGVALNDATQGLLVRGWKATLDGYTVKLQADGSATVHNLFDDVNITALSLAFDQNMRWSVGYIGDGVLKLNWYDSSINERVTSSFGADNQYPKMALDDKRHESLLTSDIILAYIRNNTLYYRQQRDRFLTERALRTNLFPGTKLKNIGLNKNLRLQFELV